MPLRYYEMLRTKLPEGYRQNPFAQLLRDRTAISAPIQGTVGEFSQILYILTKGDLSGKNGNVAHETLDSEKKNVLKFPDGSLFSVVKTKGTLVPWVIVASPYAPSMDYLVNAEDKPLSRLVSEGLRIEEEYRRAADEIKREERKLEAEKAAEEQKITRESTVEAALATVEKAASGETIMIRGLQNIDALVKLGFVPCVVDNPDNWIDADDFPGLRYRHAKSGIEVLLTGREKFRPIAELHRIELYFLVHRSDDDPASFANMEPKFRTTGRDGRPYPLQDFHDDLIALAKYPDELQGRSEADLGLIAEEVGHVIDRRQALDQGILPYEAVFNKDTRAIVDYIRENRIPAAEIRKALDYFEYTGMIDSRYKVILQQQIISGIAAAAEQNRLHEDIFHDKRVKEIVATVLRKLSGEQLNTKTVTLALAPYVSEMGFGKLIKIRERILQLKEMVRSRDGEFGIPRRP